MNERDNVEYNVKGHNVKGHEESHDVKSHNATSHNVKGHNARHKAMRAGIIGWLVILSVFVVFSIWNEADIEQYTLHADFGQIGNLKKGAPVYIGGIRVGKVLDRELRGNYRPVVTFSVRNDIRLPDDSSVSIQTDGLFGSQFLALEPGGSEKSLISGDSLTYTESAIPLARLLDMIIKQGERHLRGKQKKEKL